MEEANFGGLSKSLSTTAIGGSAAAPSNRSPLEHHLESINIQKEHTYQLISQLEQKLAGILSPANPEGRQASEKVADEIGRSPLTGFAKNHAEDMQRINARLANLIQRVEL